MSGERANGRAGNTGRSVLAEARTGLVRASLLLGVLFFALALILAPVADRQGRFRMAEQTDLIDPIVTGTVRGDARQTYVVRRSVLQEPGSAACLMYPDGRRVGGC
ncbi:hypothetical protein [Consotaella salsifontis]|uniref:hypothetical protein n=1 Tax=Consotaella salsifontis TaxID=1365950 RepID=UPI00105689CA|nr:hypothetical protein [Consotaella salsifontis]